MKKTCNGGHRKIKKGASMDPKKYFSHLKLLTRSGNQNTAYQMVVKKAQISFEQTVSKYPNLAVPVAID